MAECPDGRARSVRRQYCTRSPGRASSTGTCSPHPRATRASTTPECPMVGQNQVETRSSTSSASSGLGQPARANASHQQANVMPQQ
jgi:hypothetical protein